MLTPQQVFGDLSAFIVVALISLPLAGMIARSDADEWGSPGSFLGLWTMLVFLMPGVLLWGAVYWIGSSIQDATTTLYVETKPSRLVQLELEMDRCPGGILWVGEAPAYLMTAPEDMGYWPDEMSPDELRAYAYKYAEWLYERAIHDAARDECWGPLQEEKDRLSWHPRDIRLWNSQTAPIGFSKVAQ